MKSILDVVEEIHATYKNKQINKPQWRELMSKFKAGEQIYTHHQIQVEQEEEFDEDEEINVNEINEDYLAAVGKWDPQTMANAKRDDLTKSLLNNIVDVPSFNNFINNNSILGKAVKEITQLAVPYDAFYEKALYSVPSYMPLKLLVLGTPFDLVKEVYAKLANEYNLKIFDIADITIEFEKIMNPPQDEEVPDPK